MITIVFRIRKIYFDDIVTGRKTAEVRRVSPYWTRIAQKITETLGQHEIVLALFFCGRKQHTRQIDSVERFGKARDALGREPSEQGKQDIGEGPVFRFNLGRSY